MTRRILLVASVAVAACSPQPRDAETFARAPQRAAQVIADCDAGRTSRECVAARQGLAEARRKQRLAAYAQTFREP